MEVHRKIPPQTNHRYELGSGELPCAIECAVRKMRKGEVARVSYPEVYGEHAAPEDVGDRKRFLPGLIQPMVGPVDVLGGGGCARGGDEDALDAPSNADFDTHRVTTTPGKEEDMMTLVYEEVSLLDFVRIEVLSSDRKVRKETLSAGRGRLYTKKPRAGDEVCIAIYEEVVDAGGESTRRLVGERTRAKLHVEEEDETKCRIDLPLFLALKTMLPGEVASVVTKESCSQKIIQLKSFIRHDTVAVEELLFRKFELRQSTRAFASSRPEDGASVLVALTLCSSDAGVSPWTPASILRFRCGDGTVPGGLDACVRSMALFEDSAFEEDSNGGGFFDDKEVLFPTHGELEAALVSTVEVGREDKKLLSPLCNLTAWLANSFVVDREQGGAAGGRGEEAACCAAVGGGGEFSDGGEFYDHEFWSARLGVEVRRDRQVSSSSEATSILPSTLLTTSESVLPGRLEKESAGAFRYLEKEIVGPPEMLPFEPPTDGGDWMTTSSIHHIPTDWTSFLNSYRGGPFRTIRVWLLGVQQGKDVWNLQSSEEQLDLLRRYRLLGNAWFKRQNYAKAEEEYLEVGFFF